MKEEEQFKEIVEKSFNRMKTIKKDNDEKKEIVCERVEAVTKNEKFILEELEDYQKQLASEEYMQKKYQELLDDYQKDIESIIEKEGITDYVREKQQDLETATFEEYKKRIELYYQKDVEDLEENKKRIADASIEKQAVEWASEFLPQDEILEKPVEELANMKNMLLHIIISTDQLIPEMFYTPTELYAINLNRSEKNKNKN